jgi:acetolactate synthase small subunit
METITLTVENQVGVLERIINIFTRNRININHLEVQLQQNNESTVEITYHPTHLTKDKLTLQFYRIIEIKNINN